MTTNPNIYGNRTKFVFNRRIQLNKSDETLMRLREDVMKINELELDLSKEIVGESEILHTYQNLPNFHIMNMKMLLIVHFILSFDEDLMAEKIKEYSSDIFKIFGSSSCQEKSKIREDLFIYINYIMYNNIYDELEESEDEDYEKEIFTISNKKLSLMSSEWKKSVFTKPSHIITLDKDNRVYFTIKKNSKIVSIITEEEKNKVSIYMIPLKYLNIRDDNTYIISDSSKLSLVNCNGNPIDDYDKFVIKNIIPICK